MAANSSPTPLATVIVVARDEEQNLQQCLAAVNGQETDFDFDVLVVDSGSQDRTREVAALLGARVIEISRSEFQHGRTRQMASRQARGEFLAYLVADAVPADRHWLQALVDAVRSDPQVAGAYSRQAPREGAGPIEAYRLEHRGSFGRVRLVRRIGPDADFWAMEPAERLAFCEFDDVSCCRRKSLLARYPIPAVDWAEDLAWAKQVLLAGHKIIFEPASLVRHSHPDTLVHAFRRGFLDQTVARKWFGMIYFENTAALLKKGVRLQAEQAAVIFRSGRSPFAKAWLMLWNAARLASEIAGNYAASLDPADSRVEVDLVRAMVKRSVLKRRHREQVMETRFTLDADSRRVLFMNPNSAAAVSVRPGPRSTLCFAVGMDPRARRKRTAPVLFAVIVEGEPVWWKELAPEPPEVAPRWLEARVDLSRWAGKKVDLALVTRSSSTDHGWAGWAEPRIEKPGEDFWGAFRNRIIEKTRARVIGEPLRHP